MTDKFIINGMARFSRQKYGTHGPIIYCWNVCGANLRSVWALMVRTVRTAIHLQAPLWVFTIFLASAEPWITLFSLFTDIRCNKIQMQVSVSFFWIGVNCVEWRLPNYSQDKVDAMACLLIIKRWRFNLIFRFKASADSIPHAQPFSLTRCLSDFEAYISSRWHNALWLSLPYSLLPDTRCSQCCELFPRRSRDQETLGYLSSRSSSLLRTRCCVAAVIQVWLLLSTVEFIPFKGEGYIEVETI